MKILLTVQSLNIYAGSELHTMTLAEEFIKRGHEVDVFSAYINQEYRSKYTNINFIDIVTTDKFSSTYDLIWAHHFPTLDHCLFTCNIKSNKIIYNSLSPYMEVEKLPNYYKDLSLIICNSVETANTHIKDYNYDDIKVFPNYAPESYFKHEIKRTELKKIAVVSNHIPNEVLELEEMFNDSPYSIDYFGIQKTQKLVDDKLLLNYDLVISIGKTVDYCLALGVPVYCYDHFGGSGYLNSSTLEKEKDFNFSGRYTNRKISSKELFDEIITGYEDNQKNLETLREYAVNNICFETNFTNIVESLDSLKDTVITRPGNELSTLYLTYFYLNFINETNYNKIVNDTTYNGMLKTIEEQAEIIKNFNSFQNLKLIGKIKRILKHNYKF